MTQPDRSHPHRGDMQNTFKHTWSEAKVFASKDGTIAVKVSKSSDRFPIFNLELIAFDAKPSAGGPKKTFSRLRLSYLGRKTGRIEIVRISGIVANLIEQAEDYISEQLQTAENEWIEFSEEKAHRDIARGKPEQRPGLKKLGKMDRR